ncbi:hypothetical protein Tco_1070461 [Tanacetum coccineum]|uniref:Retrovirus-related Pol polyprotein from transposon TNT 1-94-like beta-barrel domain-containing protein n=1 Tax=Tanacetum coccineum TaxID=301880 RepID=A0ABQ5HMK2_9ASTR
MGDDHFAPIHGKGSVVLEFSSGKSITLFNVLYVPKLCKNLNSGPVLNKCGYKHVYESDKYISSKCGVFVGFGYYNNVYCDASNQGLGCVLMQRGKVENATAEMLRGLDQLMEKKEGGRYLVHSGANKTYYDLRDMYGGHVWGRILLPISWWKIYFTALVDIAEGIENTAKNMQLRWWNKVMLERVVLERCSAFGKKRNVSTKIFGTIEIIKGDQDEISLRRGYCDNCALSRLCADVLSKLSNQKNAFIGTNGEDAVQHVVNLLKIVDPLVLPNVSYERLRLVVFPISLRGEASKWFKEEPQCSIATWGDRTERFFGKYYPPSRTGRLTETKAKGDDEIALTNGKFSDLEEEYPYEDGEIAEIFRIKTIIFNYETPLCKAFNEFNYLFQINPDVLTKDIIGFMTYEEYKDDWIYEWNKDVSWYMKNHGRIMKYGKNPLLLDITVNHSRLRVDIQSGQLVAGKMTDIAIEETYLEHLDKVIMEGLINEDEESYDEAWKIWDDYENTTHNDAKRNNNDADDISNLDLVRDNTFYHTNEEEKQYEEDKCEFLENPRQDLPVCKIGRFEVIKYFFGPAKKYIAIKECERDDWPRTEENSCHAYQEIFRIMDEGWFVTRAE